MQGTSNVLNGPFQFLALLRKDPPGQFGLRNTVGTLRLITGCFYFFDSVIH
jgi:hypothetical protein